MLKKLTKLGLVCAALLAGTIQAQAARGIDVPQVSISPGTPQSVVEVISTDGERWTEIRTSKLKIPAAIAISTPTGHLIGYRAIVARQLAKNKLFAPNKPGQYSKTLTLKGKTTELGKPWQDDVIALCNSKLSSGKGIEDTHSVSLDTNVTLIAWVDENSNGTSTPHPRQSWVTIPVKCLGFPKPYSVNVFVTKKGETCPKATEVRTLIRYRTPATARFYFKVDSKLSELHTIKARKVSGKPNSGSPGGGIYQVERIKTYHLDPGQHTFRVEVVGGKKSAVKTRTIDCPPFKVTSAWLKYDVEDTPVCDKTVKEVATFKSTRPGSAPFRIKTQGGLVVNSGIAKFDRDGMEYVARIKRTLKMGAFDSDMMAEITNDPSANSGWTRLRVQCLDLTGDFSFIDNGGTRCPREGKALINFSMNIPADIHYSLDCTNGHFSGIAKAISDNKGGYVAPALVKFNIEKTTQTTCALKSVAPGKTKVHTLKGHLFQCITPAGYSGANDLTPEPRPSSDAPRTPGKVVIDPPRAPGGRQIEEVTVTGAKISCVGGYVKHGQCKCRKRTHRPIKAGHNVWRCVKKVVIDPVRPNKGKSDLSAGQGGRKLKVGRKNRRAAGKRRRNRTMRRR